MPYTTKLPDLTGVRGTHYTKESNFLYYVRSNGSSGEVYRLPLHPSTLVAEGFGITFTSGSVNLNSHGAVDIQRQPGFQFKGMNNARVAKLTDVNALSAITSDQMLSVNWSSITNNNIVTIDTDNGVVKDTFYVVRIPTTIGTINAFNYAKVRVYSSSGVVRIDWATLLFGANPIRVSPNYDDPRDIVVSEYESDIYISGVSPSGGYVARFTRLVGGPYPQYTLSPIYVNVDPLDEPQQLTVEGSFVYVVDKTSVWRCDPSQGIQEELVSGLSGGIGLLLETRDSVLRAYIIDGAGDIRIVSLSDYASFPLPAPPPVYSIGAAPGFMSWADEEHTAIYVTDRSSNRVLRLDLASGDVVPETSTPPIPWSVEVISPNDIYIASDSEIGLYSRSLTVTSVLPLGIGVIPFQYINNSEANPSSPAPDDGKVNTSSAPGYYFSQYPNLPLGGNLSLMINHELAWNSAIRFYRVSLRKVESLQGRTITSSFTDLIWNSNFVPPRFEPTVTAATNNAYPIRNPNELWFSPYLGTIIATNTSDNGHNVLKIEFLNANMQVVPNGTFERLILIDNTRYGGRLEFPRVGSNTAAPAANVYPNPATNCGCVSFDTKNDLVEIDFGAWQPQAAGEYTLSVSKGGKALPLLKETGSVTPSPTLHQKTKTSANKPIRVGHLVEDCDVANIVISLSVPSRVIDGFGWVNLSANFSRSFTLIKGAVTHSAWQEP
ncbi:hypothetical protein [Chondromyces crocatus]|uniref:Uncharacterized protein n=1 Tax=Chondromyces crocatus TaxID=52 RepID=A0A0K1EGC3_CHOCO|nr:hypothetical protein [Chondromyces crocatus]AKT39920.1 uncharacterized protein CMC5_040710 [Chondromyces crocatus]